MSSRSSKALGLSTVLIAGSLIASLSGQGTAPPTSSLLTLGVTDDSIPVANGTAWQLKALTSCSTASSAVTYNTTTNAFGCNSITSTAAGSDTQVQFNDGGTAFGGSSGLTFNKTTKVLTVTAPDGSNPPLRLVDATDSHNFSTYVNVGGAVLLVADDNLFTTFIELQPAGSISLTPTTGYTQLTSSNGTSRFTFAATTDANFFLNGATNTISADNTDAHTLKLQAYDVNGAAYVSFVTLTNANAPTFVLAPSGDGTVNVTTTLFTSSGSGLAVANVGANSCGTTAATIAGNSNSFEITVGATAGTQCRVAFPTAAPTRWNCVANNTTTANLARATPVDTTHVDFLGTFVAGDVLSGTCTPR